MSKHINCGRYIIYQGDPMNWILTEYNKKGEPDNNKNKYYPSLYALCIHLLDLMTDTEEAASIEELVAAVKQARDQVTAAIGELK